ncbi:MAG TPA: double zinc ribbon domain-containing protein, partial [Xanthobacteraceae bacterium]|nr:double zinc ribbon domain-containing protein [Xanthobacteraceae bacterium]
MTVAETDADRTGLLSAIVARFARLGRFAVDVVLPPTCLACRVPVGEGGGLCPRCWAGAGFIERPYCERLGTPFPSDYGGPLISPAALAEPPAYARARAVARYGDVVRDLVHLLKYGDRLDLVAALGRWMARAGAELLADADLLVPVPLHWTRLWQRRFNQSSVLAQEISKISGVPAADHLLSRARAAAAIRSRAQGAREKRAGRLRSAEGGARRGQRQEARARRRRADHRRHRRCLHQGA